MRQLLWRWDARSLESGGMLDVDTHAMSAWDLGVERGNRGPGTWSRISFPHPLALNGDAGTFTYLVGLKGCARVYNQATVSPAPEGRELEFALTHEAPIGRGGAWSKWRIRACVLTWRTG